MRRFLIWWLSEEDKDLIEDPPAAWPSCLKDQLASLRGRAGNGRLWVSDEIGCRGRDALVQASCSGWLTPIGRATYRRGGIVIRASDRRLLDEMPGLLTDFCLRRA